ncbi:aspartate carbamoyltransferase catalytic subunit [Leuconostoc citreum]|uniref:aspartate carbamoyltransferase catalytic subunit n=1 Tax=Leuconostoc citreum TaxID=33964 RepID=UPI001C1F7A3A|nr:aspartate carbamoyltransferase catalytic subunit [Leuconostoc citreum]MBU7450100.1 aspartate carbamoyltransferase catalytic subunit [Leuconostoc citreum]MCT3056588.1 aspartate carbamoyltransferase catalytic subunit [Leuconostoc citreum]MCT3060297.1 aspartate carbamoyltransferase catalytic subunit [Leuconostoc citreum]
MRHFLNINAIELDDVLDLVHRALAIKAGRSVIQSNLTVTNLFFENSTRTHSSFQMAENRLGYQQIDIDPQQSSMSKGESLTDTLKTLKAIGVDVAVIRHTVNNWYDQVLTATGHEIPHLINAGDGSGQHPSQSLLDLVTIYEQFDHFAGLNIRIVGDLAHSRVARSNAEILHHLGANMTFSGPKDWQPNDFGKFGQFVAIDDDWENLDVVIFLRVQHERITQTENQNFSTKQYHEQFGLNRARYERLKAAAIIMHPAPVNRDVEIADELVEAPKSRIFEQMNNGVYARMAILEYTTEATHATH